MDREDTMVKRENFWTKTIHFRGGRSGPRWVSVLTAPLFVLGVLAIAGHVSVGMIIVGVVLIIGSVVAFWRGTHRTGLNL
jgi:hypothetical protein